MADRKMTPDEALALRDMANGVRETDHVTGEVLLTIAAHLAHAHGLDIDEEDAKRKQAALDQQQQTQDASTPPVVPDATTPDATTPDMTTKASK